ADGLYARAGNRPRPQARSAVGTPNPHGPCRSIVAGSPHRLFRCRRTPATTQIRCPSLFPGPPARSSPRAAPPLAAAFRRSVGAAFLAGSRLSAGESHPDAPALHKSDQAAASRKMKKLTRLEIINGTMTA